MTQLLSQVVPKSQFITSLHKTELDLLEFYHDSVFESIDSEAESPAAKLLF